jgi:hypothetical protein
MRKMVTAVAFGPSACPMSINNNPINRSISA